MASALRRAGLRVVAKRGNFAQAQELNEFEAAAKRGGAAVDLVSLFSFPLRKFYPWEHSRRKPRRGAVLFLPPSSAASARVVGLHPLFQGVKRFAVGVGGVGVCGFGEPSGVAGATAAGVGGVQSAQAARRVASQASTSTSTSQRGR